VIVFWDEEYWLSTLAIDGGSGVLHEALASVRRAIGEEPYAGIPVGANTYAVRATLLSGLLAVVVVYHVDDPFVNLLRVRLAQG
jgi:hypothetical protein